MYECQLSTECETFFAGNTYEELEKHFEEHHNKDDKWTCPMCLKHYAKGSKTAHYKSKIHNNAKDNFELSHKNGHLINPNIIDYCILYRVCIERKSAEISMSTLRDL
jgi:hypothetical protein